MTWHVICVRSKDAQKQLAVKSIPHSVLHCASLLRTVFASLTRGACANLRVHVNNERNFPQAQLDSEINAQHTL